MKRQNMFAPLVTVVSVACFLLAAAFAATEDVRINWNDNSHNEDGFIVEVARSDGPFEALEILGPNVTEIRVAAERMALVTDVRVCAYNAFGRSQYAYADFNHATNAWTLSESYEDWSLRMFLDSIDEPDSDIALPAPDSVSSVSGLTYLECYVAGIDPRNPDESLLPRTLTMVRDGQLVQEVHRAVSKSAIGVRTRLLVSNDLDVWNEYPLEPTELKENEGIRWERIVLPSVDTARYCRLVTSLDQ